MNIFSKWPSLPAKEATWGRKGDVGYMKKIPHDPLYWPRRIYGKEKRFYEPQIFFLKRSLPHQGGYMLMEENFLEIWIFLLDCPFTRQWGYMLKEEIFYKIWIFFFDGSPHTPRRLYRGERKILRYINFCLMTFLTRGEIWSFAS